MRRGRSSHSISLGLSNFTFDVALFTSEGCNAHFVPSWQEADAAGAAYAQPTPL